MRYLIVAAVVVLSSCVRQQPAPKSAVSFVPQLTPPKLSLASLSFGPAAEPPVAIEVTCEHDKRCVPKYRFSAEVDDESSAKAVKWIEAANKTRADELLIEINSPGGSVDAGFELMRAIEDSAAPVTCVVDGEAASMGFAIMQSCAHRMITPRSRMMSHEPSIGGLIQGQPNKMRSVADSVKALADALAVHCARRLSISLEAYKSKIEGGKSWWLLADEALDVGAVDEVVDSVKTVYDKMKKK